MHSSASPKQRYRCKKTLHQTIEKKLFYIILFIKKQKNFNYTHSRKEGQIMRSEHLEIFLTVAQTGSFHKASLKLHTTHQTVSTAVTNLENELNAQLFTRDSQGAHLTNSGKIMLNYATTILENIQECKRTIEKESIDSKNTVRGKLTILVSPFINNFILPDFTTYFFYHYPHVSLQFFEMESEDILSSLPNNKGELGLFAITQNVRKNLNRLPLSTLPTTKTLRLYAITSQTHPLATYKSISTKTLSKYPLALYQSGEDTENPLLTLLTDKHDIKIHLITDNLTIYQHSLLSSSSVGILPKIKSQNADMIFQHFKDFSWIPIKDIAPITLGYSLAPMLNKKQQSLAQLFIDEITNIL